MKIDYSKKYQRKDNPEWTAENLVLNDSGKIWFTTEKNECMWCYEHEFTAGYELASEAVK